MTSLPFLDLFPLTEQKKTWHFNRLAFELDQKTNCGLIKKALRCTLLAPRSCELSFELTSIKGSTSLPLLRILRKSHWQKSYGLTQSYSEKIVRTGLGELIEQSQQAYLLDNIQRPVLLRALDVVIDDKTCISISIKCNKDDWPYCEKEISGVLSSLKKQGRN